MRKKQKKVTLVNKYLVIYHYLFHVSMPRILKHYGSCENCREDIVGSSNKSASKKRLVHKQCPSTDNKECSICLDPVAHGRVTTICNHTFHSSCLENWKKSGTSNSHTCPCCRTQIAQPAVQEPPLISQADLEDILEQITSTLEAQGMSFDGILQGNDMEFVFVSDDGSVTVSFDTRSRNVTFSM